MVRERKRFLVNEKGRKTAVVIPLREYNELLEDMADLAVIAERRDEPTEPFEVVKKRLEERWGATASK